MKRKRLEAWAVTSDNYYPNAHLYRTKKQATDDTFTGERLVRLGECGPDETVVPKSTAAVVRAAVAYVNAERKAVVHDKWTCLLRAVERMQKGRRK